MNTKKIEEYIIQNYYAKRISPSESLLEAIKIDIVSTFSEQLLTQSTDFEFYKLCTTDRITFIKDEMKRIRDYPVSKLNITVFETTIKEQKVKIVFEHDLEYFSIRDFDDDAFDILKLEQELEDIGCT